MRLILHIGTAKTGTTTLQTALKKHTRLLRKAGVLYPTPPRGRPNHNLLTTILGPTAKIQREFAQDDDADDDAIRRRGFAYWDDLRREVDGSRAELAILSGEYFYGLREESVVELERLLRDVFAAIDVVCYVRDPASYYVSMLQQRVKAAHTIRRPSQFHMRAEPCLSRYQRLFDGRLDVHSAQREALAGGDILSDFLTSFVPGVDARAMGATPDLNTSMSAEAMCIMQTIRLHGWPDRDGRFAPESKLVLDTLNEMRGTTEQSDPQLKEPLRRRFLDKHRGDLEFLSGEFGIRFDVGAGGPGRTGAEHEPTGWDSPRLVDILDVDPDDVERLTFELLQRLAARATST